jgi:hypothetical protein
VRNGMRDELEDEILSWPCLPDRFWKYVAFSLGSDCWIWIGPRSSSYKLWYPVFAINGFHFKSHRIMYQMTHGRITRKLEVHHECRNTMCVNPNHLKAVTGIVNRLLSNGVAGVNSRKTHCKRGHPLSGDNLVQYSTPKPKRVCWTCQKMWQENRMFAKDLQTGKEVETFIPSFTKEG